MFSRGLLLHERGDLTRAMRDYEQTIALNPSYPDVYINIGNICWTRDKDLPAAIRWYDQALARAENHYLGLRNRAEARLHVGDFAGTVQDATRALSIDKEPKAYAYRALAQLRLGREAAARRDAAAAIRLDGQLSFLDEPAWRDELLALVLG